MTPKKRAELLHYAADNPDARFTSKRFAGITDISYVVNNLCDDWEIYHEPKKDSALERFKAVDACEEKDPIERLRFFCSLAMSGQDWLDSEQFFDAVTERVKELEINDEVRYGLVRSHLFFDSLKEVKNYITNCNLTDLFIIKHTKSPNGEVKVEIVE